MRVYVFVYLLFVLAMPLVLGDSAQGDFDALMDIYSVTDGANWYNNDGWVGMTPETMGDAYGIETDSDGRVVRIDLASNNLVNSVHKGYDRHEGNILELIPGREFPTSVGNLDKVTFFDVRENQIAGPIPESFMDMVSLEYLLLNGRADRLPRRNSENHPGKRRHIAIQNVWTGELPQDWSRLENLFAIEISHSRMEHGLVGELPQSLFDNPSIGLILLYANSFTGSIPEISNPEQSNISFISVQSANLEGPLPASWSKLSAPYGKYFRFSGNRGITGSIPESYGDIQDLRVFFSGATGLQGPFPAFLFHDGNPRLNYFSPPDIIEGGLPAELPAQETNFTSITIFTLSNRNIEGVLPSWVGDMRLIQFNFHGNQFSRLAERFYDSDAMIYDRLRNMRINNNELSGELPDVLFTRVSHKGVVSSMSSSSVVRLDKDLGVVESGTITHSSSSWIRDRSKAGEWSSWENYFVTVDPTGGDISFEVRDATNIDSGYIYSRSRADTSNTEGLEYYIRPSVEGRVIRFKLADNQWVARKIISANQDSNEVTLDKPLDMDVSGLKFTIHNAQANLLIGNFHNNRFEGIIPQSWGYIPTDRDVRFRFYNNDFSGLIPDLSGIGQDTGGVLDDIRYYNNRFVFRDILPHFAAHEAVTSRHEYAPQRPFGPKPWGEQRVVRVEEGGDLRYSELASYVSHLDNVYQWEKGGDDVSGQDSVVLSINDFSSSDEGLYRLRVTNSHIPDLVLYSEDILVEVGSPSDDDGAFDRSSYAAPRDGFSVTDRVRVQDTAVFDTGYYSYDGRDWVEFSFGGEQNRHWVIGEAVNDQVPTDARYYAAFSCNWSSGWVCEDTWQVLET